MEDRELYHYGVKGMKWGVRKGSPSAGRPGQIGLTISRRPGLNIRSYPPLFRAWAMKKIPYQVERNAKKGPPNRLLRLLQSSNITFLRDLGLAINRHTVSKGRKKVHTFLFNAYIMRDQKATRQNVWRR